MLLFTELEREVLCGLNLERAVLCGSPWINMGIMLIMLIRDGFVQTDSNLERAALYGSPWVNMGPMLIMLTMLTMLIMLIRDGFVQTDSNQETDSSSVDTIPLVVRHPLFIRQIYRSAILFFKLFDVVESSLSAEIKAQIRLVICQQLTAQPIPHLNQIFGIASSQERINLESVAEASIAYQRLMGDLSNRLLPVEVLPAEIDINNFFAGQWQAQLLQHIDTIRNGLLTYLEKRLDLSASPESSPLSFAPHR